jgi:cysteinyl-tRNA synthetase
MKLYNTLTRQKEALKPLSKKGLKMFVCGPTVWDFIHVGNARTFIVFDVIAKYLRYRGYKLYYLQNITDIDDKIINRAKEEGRNAKEVADEFEKEYFTDLKALGIDSIDKHARASEHIKEIIAQINRLIENGYAYVVPSVHIESPDAVNNKDVYFDVSKFEEYGKLSRQKLEELEEGTRIKTEANKDDPKDFALWKAKNYSYEPTWESPWGMGRPGWHIEDTAISEKYLSQQYDIHCGAIELAFPHHESEIAQQEAASGKKPFVRYWLHSGVVNVNGEKMAKSLGNFVTVRDALKSHSPESLRFFSISTHYRSPIDWSEKNIIQAEAAIERIAEFLLKLRNISAKIGERDKETQKKLDALQNKFTEFMDDDFSTPEAIAALFEFIRDINPFLDKGQLSTKSSHKIGDYLLEINKIFGVIPQKTIAIPRDIQKLVDERERLRKEKQFEKADELREQITSSGYVIEDTIYGPLLKNSKRKMQNAK